MTVLKLRVLVVIFSFFERTLGGLDASAVLLECENNSSKNDIKRTTPPYHTIDNCTRKIRITLNITNTGKTPEDLDYSFLNQLFDPGTGVNMFLLNPIILRLRQDQVLLAYPFNYLSAVNGKASEVVVNYQNTKNFTGCDDTSQINPTCGLKHDRGKAIPFSQGFCCFCPETPENQKQPRGGQDCSLNVGDPADLEKQKFKASAHCLQLSDIWYSVSAISDPSIFHETYMQVYNQRHLKNGSSVWVALTHDEDFELGLKNPYQYDQNRTILISYTTNNPKEKSITLPLENRRLLTPQPMPAVEVSKLPAPVKNGANDYLLIPQDLINSLGDACDVGGVSYEAFANQEDRCENPKDTCLRNQPLDFWLMDDEKRKSGSRGSYILENFAKPYKDPIIVHPDTKEHWLATEYYESHLTSLVVEINADEIAILTIGKFAQISKIMSATTTKIISIYVSVLNRGLMPARFSVKATKCAFGVGESNNASVVIPPQMTEDLLVTTKPGSTALDEKFSCTVQVASPLYGVVASREVVINPFARCVCNFHCKCACLSDSLKCELMSEEDYHAAGFRGSLPVLTAKPPHHFWFVKHPLLALLAIVLFFLLLGFIKGMFGLAGYRGCGNFGMEKFLFQPKKIKGYTEPSLRNMKVMYDAEGYPIHPDTKERVSVIGDEWLFALNCLFCFFWPCSKTRDIIAKKKAENQKKKTGESTGVKSDTPKKKRFGLFRKGSPKRSEGPPKAGKDSGKKTTERSSAGDRSKATARGGHTGNRKMRRSISDSDLDLTTGPIADPLNKELERWQRGKGRIQAIRK